MKIDVFFQNRKFKLFQMCPTFFVFKKMMFILRIDRGKISLRFECAYLEGPDNEQAGATCPQLAQGKKGSIQEKKCESSSLIKLSFATRLTWTVERIWARKGHSL